MITVCGMQKSPRCRMILYHSKAKPAGKSSTADVYS